MQLEFGVVLFQAGADALQFGEVDRCAEPGFLPCPVPQLRDLRETAMQGDGNVVGEVADVGLARGVGQFEPITPDGTGYVLRPYVATDHGPATPTLYTVAPLRRS
ncbi:hypothetical protein OG361_38815 [Streptomyces sp. NBC_00090]|uniref:hypothetical protein n=1 Tax=Streptomyces sp. NBC_00090 TaxID=2903619 RepID=UPI0032499758